MMHMRGREGAVAIVLNEPTGWQPAEPQPEWAPERGLRRGAIAGAALALLLIAVLVPIAMWVPYLLFGLLRIVVGFGITWALAAAVQRSAGMVGWPCTGIAVGLALVVLVSNHVVFALCGVPTRSGYVAGWEWLSPATLFVMNGPALVGVGFAAALCHSGSDILSTVIDIVMRNPYTGRR
jgi:hypothetical protein